MRKNIVDPNRPVGQKFDYITDSYQPEDNLTLQEKNEDIVRSMGLMPQSMTPSIPLTKLDQVIENEIEESNQFQPDEIPEPIIPQDTPSIAPAPKVTQPALEQSSEDLASKLISEYAEAARQSTKNKRDVAANEGITQMLQSLVGYGYSTTPAKTPDFSKQYELAEAPLDELQARDRGTAAQQKLSAQELELGQARQTADPNSSVSKLAREQYARVLTKLGSPDLAQKIMDENMSYESLKNIYGKYNLVNMEAITASQEAKNERAMMAMNMRQEKEQVKDQKEAAKFVERAAVRVNKLDKEILSNARSTLALANEALNNPSGPIDYSLIIKYLKSLDDSVAREGEVATFRNTLGISGQIQTELSRYGKNPRMLPPGVVQKIQQEAQRLVNLAETEFQGKVARDRNVAEQFYGLPADQFDQLMNIGNNSKPRSTAGSAAPAGMVRMTNGKETLDVPADSVQDAKKDGFREI